MASNICQVLACGGAHLKIRGALQVRLGGGVAAAAVAMVAVAAEQEEEEEAAAAVYLSEQ